MSVALMTLAFRAKVASTRKLVLLALCDSANDQGECYPSIPTLTNKCSLSERAVQSAITDLERSGHLRRELRNGRSTVYWMTPHGGDETPAPRAPRTTCTPAAGAPTPALNAPPPPQQVHPTPAAGAPITIKETSVETSRNQKKKGAAPAIVSIELLVEAGFDADSAADFIAHKASVKAPLTERAWADHKREAAKAGWSPLMAAEKVMARGWKGFDSSYVAGTKQQARASPSKQSTEARDAEAKRMLFGSDDDSETTQEFEAIDG